MLVPARRIHMRKIPIAMITGTKGKTTTTRILAHILTHAGHRVGFTSTDGVVIDGEYICRDDSSGYVGARAVLGNKSVTAAVLETARGDLLNSGLFIDRCDAAALLNVGREQIGISGINTLEQMAALKQRVVNTARKAVVLNADDKLCAGMIEKYPPGRVILFSLRTDNQIVNNHIQQGGTAYVLNDSAEAESVDRREGRATVTVVSTADLPSCRNGLFPQNIANAMAAAALAEGLGIPLETVAAALRTFENSLEHSPGRFNFIDGYSQTILIDSATNVPSCSALVKSLGRIDSVGRRLCMFETPGNRPAWHYTELGEILGPHFDHFVCYEVEKYQRGRVPGEISALLKDALVNAGVSPQRIDTAQGYADATKRLSKLVKAEDFVTILMPDIHVYLPILREHFAAHETSGA